MSDYLTTREVADLLRIKERKVYELVSNGQLPHSKVIGKLLFPRAEVEAWINGDLAAPGMKSMKRPAILLGSHDPLLDWAVRESRCGIATLFDSSLDGLARFRDGEGLALGMHVPDPDGHGWNVERVTAELPGLPLVVVEWAWRQRGLVVNNRLKEKVSCLADLKGMRLVPRQPEAGSQILFEKHLAANALSMADLDVLDPARSEAEIASMVAEGTADAGFTLQNLADPLKTAFVPITRERYDLVIDRFYWFEPAFQRFIKFLDTEKFRQRATASPGYDFSTLLTVHHNSF